jgi:hypothetical protein
MKKITLLFLLLAFAVVSFCQQNVPKHSLSQANYLRKSENQKKTAWILLAGGAVLTATSFLISEGEETDFNARTFDYDHKNDGIKAALGLTGIASMLGSIPFSLLQEKTREKPGRPLFLLTWKKHRYCKKW